jgi:hypothetical protein
MGHNECIAIKRYQTWRIYMLYASLNTTLSPKSATGSSGPKVGILSTRSPDPLKKAIHDTLAELSDGIESDQDGRLPWSKMDSKIVEKVETYSNFNPRLFPFSPQNSGGARDTPPSAHPLLKKKICGIWNYSSGRSYHTSIYLIQGWEFLGIREVRKMIQSEFYWFRYAKLWLRYRSGWVGCLYGKPWHIWSSDMTKRIKEGRVDRQLKKCQLVGKAE